MHRLFNLGTMEFGKSLEAAKWVLRRADMMADLLLERAFCLTTSMFSADFDLHKAAEWLLSPELMNKKKWIIFSFYIQHVHFLLMI